MNENEGMETRTLGQIIGVVGHSFNVRTDGRSSTPTQLSVKFDFTTSSDADIKSWLCGSRAIAMARPTRELSNDEIKELNGQTIMANECGRKVESRSEKIAKLKNIGLSEEFAIMAVDDPEGFKALMNKTNEKDN